MPARPSPRPQNKMSFVYELLCEYKNYQGEEDNRGKDLYNRLYDEKGKPIWCWQSEYEEWCHEICDLLEIPKGAFRNAWVNDAIQEAIDADLQLIKDWFKPE